MKCAHCNQQLRFEPGKGWVHRGGSPYVTRCVKCGHQENTTGIWVCPRCRGEMVDDHRAIPMYDDPILEREEKEL